MQIFIIFDFNGGDKNDKKSPEQWFINVAGSQRSARFARDCWNLAWSRNVTSWKKVVKTESSWFSILMGVTEMGKSSPARPLCRYSITLFWRFLGPQGGPLSGPGQLLTLLFQNFQSRRLVWNNKINFFWMGKHRPKPLKWPYFQP
jgi:hypothetical protein